MSTPDFKLYLITDRKMFTSGCSLYSAVEDTLNAGAKFLQLREKDLPTRQLLDMAYWMTELTKEYGAKLLINDRVDIALAAGADGEPIGIKTFIKVKSGVSIPVLAVGGIKLNNVNKVMAAGADGIALISAIFTAEKIKETTEEFLKLL